MIQSGTELPLEVKDPSGRARQIQTAMKDVGRRQWWLWSSAMMVTLLLTLGIASFAFPGLLSQESPTYPIDLNQALRGLAGLVLLFNVYTVYQQLQIRRLQTSIAEQVSVMDKMEARTEEVFKLAILDPLAGLYNRRCGEQRLMEEITRSKRHGHPLTVIALDLNKLKYVNDTYGHAAGDELIKCFAARINKAIRGSDLAVRQGGDEFLLLLPECKPDEVRHVLMRLSGIKADISGQMIPISFSAGWANYIAGESSDELL
jgi:diguanylate cyclase (GGDEF)-like protein